MKIGSLILRVGFLSLFFLCGCGDPASVMKKFTPPEDEAVATNYIALLRQGKFEKFKRDLDPDLKDVITQETLVKMAAAIPEAEPISVKVVGAHQVNDPGLYRINLSFEYQFPSNWMVINVATQKKDGVSTIIGFHVYKFSDSLENFNRFTLTGKKPLQYVTLVCAVAIPLFILSTLVICLRTKMKTKKWLWIIFILIGFGKFTVNWTTGQWHFGLLYFQLLGGSAVTLPYCAWMISISVPLGAILFLLRRKELAAPIEVPLN